MKNGSTMRVVDLASGRQWDVEAIQPRRQNRPEFGESLSSKCDGAISEAESRISEKTHSNIRYVKNPSEI